jgi:hypothetical protein
MKRTVALPAQSAAQSAICVWFTRVLQRDTIEVVVGKRFKPDFSSMIPAQSMLKELHAKA